MKTLFALLVLVVAVTYAQNAIDAHLFDGLVRELLKMLRSLNHDQTAVTQLACVNDCNSNLGLSTTMCGDICVEAAKKYPMNVLPN